MLAELLTLNLDLPALAASVTAPVTPAATPTPVPTPSDAPVPPGPAGPNGPGGLCDNPVIGKLPMCLIGGAVGNAASGIAAGLLGEVAQAVVAAVAEVLGAVLDFLSAPVRPDLGTASFAGQFTRMVSASAWFAVLLFLLAVGRAIWRGSLGELGRVAGWTVAAFATTGVALWVVQAFLALTDSATAQVAEGVPGDMAGTFAALIKPLTPLALGSAGQAVLALLLAAAVGLGALAVYLELFLRNVMIHVVAYFVPLLLACAILPATRRWAKRGAEFLAVLVVSKFVLYATIALGWSSVAAFDDEQLSTAWASALTGIVLLAVAAFLPVLLFRLLPVMEAQVAAGMTRRDARAAVTAPAAAVGGGLRTVEANLRRAATVAALVGTGGAGPAAVGAAGTAGSGSAAARLSRAASLTGGLAGTTRGLPPPRPARPMPHGTPHQSQHGAAELQLGVGRQPRHGSPAVGLPAVPQQPAPPGPAGQPPPPQAPTRQGHAPPVPPGQSSPLISPPPVPPPPVPPQPPRQPEQPAAQRPVRDGRDRGTW